MFDRCLVFDKVRNTENRQRKKTYLCSNFISFATDFCFVLGLFLTLKSLSKKIIPLFLYSVFSRTCLVHLSINHFRFVFGFTDLHQSKLTIIYYINFKNMDVSYFVSNSLLTPE